MSGAALPTLARADVRRGDRWIFSAGFNVARDLGSTGRIDSELGDLERLAEAGAAVALISHQGSRAEGSVDELDYVAAYLAERLGRTVGYCPDCVSPAAHERANRLRPGELVLFGNTRRHGGEQRNDRRFAGRLAALGDRVAVGGFSKAHRAHASNVGILAFRPGVAATSIRAETELLEPWAGSSPRFSVAILGGRKREKTLVGLARLVGSYDLVIPGGAVLNVLLAARGYDVGASDLGEHDADVAAAARRVLATANRAELHLPSTVIVRAGGGRARAVAIADGVAAGAAIVDFVLEPWALQRLRRLAAERGRALLAGTPTLYTAGFTGAASILLEGIAARGVDALLLGGDTVAELPWTGRASTGGGAALCHLAGIRPVIDALANGGARTEPWSSST